VSGKGSDSLAEAERLAAAIGPLRLGRQHARLSIQAGQHAQRRAGSGTEFWQYRPLAAGEAHARVDWRRSARSDDFYVREREREEPGRLLLWVDGSGSMRFRSGEQVPEKFQRAHEILVALAIAAKEAEEHVRVAGSPDVRTVPAIAQALIGLDQRFDPARVRPGDMLVIASDFLDGGSLDFVERLSGQGIGGVLLTVVDPAEDDFPFKGHVRFERSEPHDPETDVGRAEMIADRYSAAWGAHRERLKAAGGRAGWTQVMHRTDIAAAAALETIAGFLRDGREPWAA
jgi:uncharacterized protein (DUF58 family)|tara:strand:- start:155276 stop:156136 length:861 start_codon:yes stop_codon:yes gene_type:complete